MRKILSFLMAVLFAGSLMAQEVTVSKTVNDLFPNDANGTQEATLYSDAAISISVNADGNNGKIYGTGTEWRLYQTNSAVVTVAATDATIKSVAFEFTVSNTGALKFGETTMTSNTAVDVKAASAQFVVANSGSATNGQVRIKGFTVVYEATGGDDPTDPTPAEILQGYADDLKAVIDAAGKWNLNVTDLETYYGQMVQAIQAGDENTINQYIAYAQNLMAQVQKNVITVANSVLEDELGKLITDEIPADKVQACQEAVAAAIQTAALAWDTNESAAYNLSALEGLVFNKIIPEVEAQIEEILKEGGDDPVSGDITILPSDFTAVENADYSTTKSGVTVAVTASTVTADQMRIFQGKTITLSVASGNITKIVFTCTANGDAKYGPGCLTTEVGSYSFDASGPTGTWEGSAQSITFNTSKQVRATEIVVTVGEGGDVPPVQDVQYYLVGSFNIWEVSDEYQLIPNTAATAEGEYIIKDVKLADDAQFKVIGVNPTDGAQTWYPDGMGNNYGENGELTEAGTYNIYFRPDGNGGDDWFYNVIYVEKQETPVVEPITCLDVYQMAKNDVVNLLNDVTVTYANGKNVWVRDGSASMLIYFTANTNYVPGDVLSGIAGVVDIYNGVYEVKPSADQAAAISVTAGEAPAAIQSVVVETADMNKYIVMPEIAFEEDAAFAEGTASNITMNGVVVRNNFKNAYEFKAGKKYNIYGVVTIYQNNPQVYFITAEEVGGEDPAKVVFTVNVPAGTETVYIAGSFNDWTFDQMEAVAGAANQFTFTLEGEYESLAYKYLAGPDWTYEEVDAEGRPINDRSYAALDEVIGWAHVPGEGSYTNPVFTVNVPAGTEKVYIAGSFNNWGFTEMTAVESVANQFTLTLDGEYDALSYKYLAGPDWTYGEVDAEGNETSNRSYNGEVDEVARWRNVPAVETITCAEVYNLASGAAVALKEVVVTYRHSSFAYVRDASGEAQGGMLLYLNTETQQTCEWKAGDRLIGVTGTVAVYNNLYEITMTDDQFALITVQEDYAPQAFLVENMTSDEINQYIVIEHVKLEGMFYETGKSTTITSTAPVEINFFNKFHLAATFEEGKSYTIYGVGSIYGETLQVNFISAVEEELSGYFVVGSFNEWTPSEEYRLDYNQGQPAYMEWKLSDLKLTEGDQLKVVSVAPGEENIWYPASEEGNNHNYVVESTDVYNIYFRPNGNADWGYYYFELVPKEEPVTPNWTIAEFIQNEGGKCYLTGVVSDIMKYNDGSYNKYGNFNLTDESGTIYVYGLLTAEGEAQQFANMGVDENDTLTVLAETYEYYQQTTHEVKNAIYVSHKDYVEPVDPSEDVAFYLVGTILESNWEIAESGRYLFEATDVEGEYWLRETLDGGDECKVRGVDVTGAPNGWYPDGLDNNYIIPGESTQPVEIFFRPKGDGGDGWHYGYIFTLPQIRLDGAFTNWENYIVMNVAADKQSASVTIDIEEPGEYQFVLYVGVDGRSLCGEDEYSQYTLTRDRYWANALTYRCEGVGTNMALNADVAGTYVAHYEYASGNLWFDFPSKEISAYEVAEAIEAQLTDDEEINVRGVIKNMTFKGTNFAKYGSVCIYVEDATGAEGEFEYFNCYSFNEAKFVYSDYDPESTDWISFDEIYDENGNALHVGDTVIAHGAYKLYNNTKHELNTGCYIVDVIHPTFVPDESENVVVYLLNTLNWNEVYAYVWKEWHSQAYEWCIWPGIAMRPIVAMNAPAKDKANKQDDAGKYRVEFPKAYDKIIFSGMEIDTRYQTEDLQVEAGKTFVLGEWNGQVYTGEWVEDATAIGNINTNTVEAVKVLENGQILIIKNGKIFNITGQIVK